MQELQELQANYNKITQDYQRTLVRLQNSELILGAVDRLDAAVADFKAASRILVDTFVSCLNAKAAVIFVTDIRQTEIISEAVSSISYDELLASCTERLNASRKAYGKEGNFRYIYGVHVPDVPRDLLLTPNPKSIFWVKVHDGHPFSVTNKTDSPFYKTNFEKYCTEDFEFHYWIPLLNKLDNKIIGLVGLNIDNPEVLETEFIERLISHGERALRNAVLNRRLETSRIALAHQVHKLETLYNVGKALSAIDDRNRLLRDILKYAVGTVKAQKGSIMLLEEATNELVVSVVYGIDPDTEDKILRGVYETRHLKIGEGVAGQVAKTRVPAVIDNTGHSSVFVRNEHSNVSSILCVPLIVHDDLQGVLNITNKEMGAPFNSDDLQIIMQVADQAAVALYNARLYELAVTDGLTKVFIRRHFFSKFSEEIKRLNRSKSHLSLIMLDIDFFKSVNDTYGHQCGDYVLSEVAATLRSVLRDIDIIGRYGGEEFAILLLDSDANGAFKAACRIQKALEESVFIWELPNADSPAELRISVSIGISCHPDNASDPAGLIKCADAAMYYSKRHGRNRTTIYNEDVRHFIEKAQSGEFETTERSPGQ